MSDDGDVAMIEDTEQPPAQVQPAKDSDMPKITSSDDSQSSGSLTTMPTTPSSNEFDPGSQREPVIPALARLARKPSSLINKSTRKAPATAAKAVSKTKPKPRKRAASSGPKAPPKAKKIATTPKPKATTASRVKKAPAPATAKPQSKGKRTADVVPSTIAQFER